MASKRIGELANGRILSNYAPVRYFAHLRIIQVIITVKVIVTIQFGPAEFSYWLLGVAGGLAPMGVKVGVGLASTVGEAT